MRLVNREIAKGAGSRHGRQQLYLVARKNQAFAVDAFGVVVLGTTSPFLLPTVTRPTMRVPAIDARQRMRKP